MAVVVIVGAQWGDEGKGKVVDLYTEHADVVARFGGGANAGHTLVVGGQKLVTHLLPSGVLHPGKLCVLGEGMVIEPKVLLEEIEGCKARGLLADDRDLLIAERAHVILGYHRVIDELRESGGRRARDHQARDRAGLRGQGGAPRGADGGSHASGAAARARRP